MKVHLNIDKEKEETEVNIQTHNEEIGEGLLKHINQYSTPNKSKLGVKTSNGILMIEKSDIMFAEIFGKELSIITTEEEITTRQSLQALQNELSSQNFVQITKSSIINIQYVKKISPSFSGNFTTSLTSGNKVSISRRYVKNLNKALRI